LEDRTGPSPAAIFVNPSVWDFAVGLILYHRYIDTGSSPVVLDYRSSSRQMEVLRRRGYKCILAGVSGDGGIEAEDFLQDVICKGNDKPAMCRAAQNGLNFLRGCLDEEAVFFGSFWSFFGMQGFSRWEERGRFSDVIRQYAQDTERTIKRILAREKGRADVFITTGFTKAQMEDSFFCGYLRSMLDAPMLAIPQGGKDVYAAEDRYGTGSFAFFLEKTQEMRWTLDTATRAYRGKIRQLKGIKDRLAWIYKASVKEARRDAILSSYGLTGVV